MSNSYRDLIAWRTAIELALSVYRVTESLPKHELYGLSSQLRRAVVSVPSNIAEGQARNSRGEFRQFLAMAKGSLVEAETQLLIASRLGYIPASSYEELTQQCDRVSRLLNGLLRSLTSPSAGFQEMENEKRETRNEKLGDEKRETRNEKPRKRGASA